LLDDQFFYKRKSKNDKSRIKNYLSTLLTILVYGGVMYGTYIYYGLKITDNWIIESNIGTLSILLIIDDNLVLTFASSPFFFL